MLKTTSKLSPMKKSPRHLLLLSLTGCMLSSCVYVTQSVPDMPYEGTAGRTQYPDTWIVSQPTGIDYAPIPDPVTPATPTPIAPSPTNVNAPLDLTQPLTPVTTRITPQPVVTPKPAATPAPAPAAAKPATAPKQEAPALRPIPTTTETKPVDMSQITNTGPSPVATRVPGDPTRVYNPLNPSKTIRVVDKNGNPYPSGKELKVRGTNFHFYVP